MARVRVPITVIDLAGNAVNGAAVHVKLRSSGASATVYQNETGPTTVTNPLSTDSAGRVSGWVERGAYKADVSGTGISSYTQEFEAAPAENRTVDSLWLPQADPFPTFVAEGGALPASPFDGQLINYQASAALGVVWQFRYRAGSASTYKWEFVGGSPLSSEVATAEATISTAYVDLATVGPSITVPRAGDFIFDGFVAVSNASASNNSYSAALKIGAAATSDSDLFQSMMNDNSTTGTRGLTGGSRLRRNVPTANSVCKIQYKTSNGAASPTFARRALSVTPVRIS
jgi:hypothetical protein